MKRRGFLAGLLATPLLPHLPVPAEELSPVDIYKEAAEVIHSGDKVTAVINLSTGQFSFAFNSGIKAARKAYAFPNHPVIPTKTVRFCNGRG